MFITNRALHARSTSPGLFGEGTYEALAGRFGDGPPRSVIK